MEYTVVEIDEPLPMVRRITLNRPEKRNALNHALRGQLLACAARGRRRSVGARDDRARCRAELLGGLRPRRRQRGSRDALLHTGRRGAVAPARHRGLDEHLGSRQGR